MIARDTARGGTWDRDVLTVLLARLPAAELTPPLHNLIGAGLGAVLLPAGTGRPTAELAELSRSVHDLREDCAVLAAEEGGEASVLQPGGSFLPTARALGEIDDVDLTRKVGDALGDLLAACDVDLVLAPVLDVATGPDPLIGNRSFGDDPDLVERHGRAMASGVRDAGVAVCGMHFPGIGALSAAGDAVGSPGLAGSVIQVGRRPFTTEHLGSWDLVPWLDAVLVTPVSVPALGPGPASLAAWTAPLLDELSHSGYHGLLISADLPGSARAASCSLGEAAVRAVEAGAHLVDLGALMDLGAPAQGESAAADPRGADASAAALARVEHVHDALTDAMTSGRLDDAALRTHAEVTRARLSALRARRRWLTAPALPTALDALATIGTDAALRAVKVRRARLDLQPVAVLPPAQGSTPAPGPVHDSVHGSAHTSMRGPSAQGALVAALRSRGIDARGHEYEQDALRAPQLLVLTRRPRTDRDESARLQQILAARPDAIVIHTGSPQTAPEHERTVLSHGESLAMMQATAAALLESSR